MASIDKLSIRGIRSFSPNDDMTIQFYSPLTMIVGANGCGKTSIIESLKYACTGALPPTCKNGQSFINDPTMTDQSEVKAQVKLRFKNKAGKTSVVVRSMQLTKKKAKLEFKALDGCIRSIGENNQSISTSHKCTELDKHVPDMLGVSPSILENVIFCHQEDSNWPMGEGIVLKKKFDDVFESTRYTKALEAIQKSKKDYTLKAKDFKAEMMELGAHQQAAAQARRELETTNENRENCENELESINDKLTRNEDRLKRCTEIINRASKKASEFQALQWRVEETERRLSEKSNALERPMQESDEQLESMLANFEDEMKQRSKLLRDLQKAVDALNGEIGALRAESDQLNTQRGLAVSLSEQMDQSKKTLCDKMQQAVRKHKVQLPASVGGRSSGGSRGASASGISLTPEVITVQVVREFIQGLNNKLQRMRDDGETELSTLQKTVDECERACAEQRTALQRNDMLLDAKRVELEKNASEHDKKRSELASLVSARSALQLAERDFEEAKTNEDEFMKTYTGKSNEAKRLVKEAAEEIRTLTDQMSSDAELLQTLSMHRSEIAALTAAERQLSADRHQLEAETQTALEAHREILNGCGVRVPEALTYSSSSGSSSSSSGGAGGDKDAGAEAEALTPLVTTMAAAAATKQSELKSAREKLAKLRGDLGGTTALLTQQQERLASASARRKDLQSETSSETSALVRDIMDLRNGDLLAADFEDEPAIAVDTPVSEIVDSAVLMEQKLQGYATYSEAYKAQRKRFEKAKKKAKGACPCCQREMNDPATQQAYETSMNALFALHVDVEGAEFRQTLETTKALVTRARALQVKVQPLEGLRAEVSSAEEEVSDLTEKHRQLETEECALEDRVDSLENLLAASERASSALSELKSRWQALANRQRETQQRRQRQSQSAFVGDTGGRSIEDIESEQRQRSERKDDLLARKEKAAAEETRLTTRLNSLRMLSMEKERELNEARQKGARHGGLEQAMKQLQQQREELESARRAIAQDRDAAERQVAVAEQSLKNARGELKQREELQSSQLSLISTDRDDILRAVESLDQLQSRAAKADLASVLRRLEDNQSAIAEKEENVRTHVPQINALNAEISSQERTKRVVRDNLDLRECERELGRLREELAVLEEEVNSAGGGGAGAGGQGMSLKDAQRENQRATQERDRLKAESASLQGKIEIYEQQAAELQAKLNGPNYRGVDEKHRRKSIEYETTMMAVSDLGSYYDALDLALQNFHTLRIREINKIIRELWQLIYKGQDIDVIELESGQESAVDGGAAGGRGSRSYNYRVVMRKGDVPLDMRGRCSAGQRVLAAIVIRLALAETFCLNCGILALDEPTTNLDEANKAGLAHALAKIILDRSRPGARQSNFQLICITHDEDFVRLMSSELATHPEFALPEYYFRVSREIADERAGKFFSRIERISWDEMDI